VARGVVGGLPHTMKMQYWKVENKGAAGKAKRIGGAVGKRLLTSSEMSSRYRYDGDDVASPVYGIT